VDVASAGATSGDRSAAAIVVCAEAIEFLRTLPSESVNLVLTSPPYNIGKPYERAKPVDEYVAWCCLWLAELWRVCRPDASVWLNLGYMPVPGRGTAVPITYLLWEKLPFHLVQEVVWHYRAGVACRKRFSPRNEKLLWLVKNPNVYAFDLDAVRCRDVRYPNQRRHGRLRCNPAGRNPSDVWEIPKVTAGAGRASRERTAHPAQMPLELAERVVRACSRPGDVVLDPFAGSGTTAVAALLHGRNVIAIELDPTYSAIAEQRVARCVRSDP
jgi:adenine-specific DNA-methyltransferase